MKLFIFVVVFFFVFIFLFPHPFPFPFPFPFDVHCDPGGFWQSAYKTGGDHRSSGLSGDNIRLLNFSSAMHDLLSPSTHGVCIHVSTIVVMSDVVPSSPIPLHQAPNAHSNTHHINAGKCSGSLKVPLHCPHACAIPNLLQCIELVHMPLDQPSRHCLCLRLGHHNMIVMVYLLFVCIFTSTFVINFIFTFIFILVLEFESELWCRSRNQSNTT